MLDAFGERVAVFIGGPQFASWQRQVSDEEGTIDGVKQSVMEVTRNLPEDVVQIDLYQSLLARLLEDMRNLIRADDLLPEDDDDDWLQERTFALDLKANAETGILRGLEKGETNWAQLIAAGHWLTVLTHALVIRTLENAETRNRVNIQSLSYDGET